MALKSTKFIIVSEFTYFDYILYIWDVEELSLLPLLESDRKYISFFVNSQEVLYKVQSK